MTFRSPRKTDVMIDHFRTLLLNESAADLPAGYTARSVHIDPGYGKLTLPDGLAQLYGMLFPSINVEMKLRMAQAYMELINAAGLEAAVTKLDPRTTYSAPDDTSLFQLKTSSNGVPAAVYSGASLRVFNLDYRVDSSSTLVHDLSVVQTGSSANITIFEDSTTWLPSTALVFTNSQSQIVPVYYPAQPKVKAFDLVLKYPGTFTATSNKSWELTIAAPSTVLLRDRWATIRSNAQVISGWLAKYPSSPDAGSYDKLFAHHFNSNYQLAGLVVALVYKLDNLRR